MAHTLARPAFLFVALTAAGSAAAWDPTGPFTPRCLGAEFDGQCVTRSYAESLVDSEGQTYLDHQACTDDAGARMDDCLEITLEKLNGTVWTHRIVADACTESAYSIVPRTNFKDCYAGYEFVGKTRHDSELYMGEDGYTLINSQHHWKTTFFGWDKFARTDMVTTQTGWNVSSGISTDVSVVLSDGDGNILDSEYLGWSLIADTAGTPTIAEKCSAARDRMTNTGPDVTDLMYAVCDYFEIDEGGLDGFFSNGSVFCDSVNDAYGKLTEEAAAVFYDECLSHANEFFPELYGPDETGTDPMFDPPEELDYLNEDNVNNCAEASFIMPYTAYLQDENGDTWTCEGTAEAECGTLNTGACGCVYEFLSTPTCTIVTVDG